MNTSSDSKDLNDFLSIIEKQESHKSNCINLIASENIISNRVRELQGSLLSNRYILDDFPNNAGLFEIQRKLKIHLSEMFHAKYVNISSLSGMSCMSLLIGSLTEENQNIYTLRPMDGGHGSTNKVCKRFDLNNYHLPVSIETYRFDIKTIEEEFKAHKPDLIYLDNTIICFFSPLRELSELAVRYNTPIIYDGSHVLGLIAGRVFPNPLEEGADILNGSTHKTFFGSQKGIIVTNDQNLIEKINTFSTDYISSIHTGSLLALYMSVLEMKEFGSAYAEQIVKNAQALGAALQVRDVCVPTYQQGITQTHQVWIDTRPIDAFEAFNRLAACNINTNPIRIPAIQRTGLRLGVAEVTRLGMKEEEMEIIADFISSSLQEKESVSNLRKKISNFSQQYQKIKFTFDV